MSGHGAPKPASIAGQDLSIAVIASSWHNQVMNGLIDGARRAAEAAGAAVTMYRVPGSFELAVVAAEAARTGCDAVVALGVVIRGGTPHFDYVCRAATDGLNRVAVDARVPVGFGLLTCDTEQQALDRAGLPGSVEDKGFEAAQAALQTALVLRQVRGVA